MLYVLQSSIRAGMRLSRVKNGLRVSVGWGERTRTPTSPDPCKLAGNSCSSFQRKLESSAFRRQSRWNGEEEISANIAYNVGVRLRLTPTYAVTGWNDGDMDYAAISC
jgi:hypothetical protein